MRPALLGVVLGLSLSLLRAPAGFDWVQAAAAHAGTRYLLRALALFLVAATFASRRRLAPAREVIMVLAGALLGFGVHGLLLADRWAIGGRGGLLTVGLSALALITIMRIGWRPPPTKANFDGRRVKFETTTLELLGLAVCGAGLAIALEGLARYVRLFGGATRDDDAVFALAFVAMTFFGALSFGGLAKRSDAARLLLPIALAIAAALASMGLRVVGNLASPRGLDGYFRHPWISITGVDGSSNGTLLYDLLIASSCFIAPCLLLGLALGQARKRSQIASICVGAGLGLLTLPGYFAALDASPSSAALVGRGVLLCALGLALAVGFAPRDRLGSWRWVGVALALGIGLVPRFATGAPPYPVSPWLGLEIAPRVAFECAEGLLTIEGGELGLESVTLERRPLAPDASEAFADAERMRQSMQLCPPVRRAQGSARVLLVGQLTPGRALVLQNEGAGVIDRTAAWHEAMERLETELFGTEPALEGERLAPREARERILDGRYDLVLVPPLRGSATRRSDVLSDLPRGTAGVLWLDARDPLAQLDLGQTVALSADGLEGLTLGVAVQGSLPSSYPAGDPNVEGLPWTRLSMREEERWYESRARTTRRLAESSRGTKSEELMRAVASFDEGQRRSSPFENYAERAELPEATLDALRAAALGGELDPFGRGVWTAVARVLVGKRWIAQIYEFVEPVAQEKGAEWPVLTRALVHADLESLDPDSAVKRSESLVTLEPERLENWLYRGEALHQTNRMAEAAEAFRTAYGLLRGEDHEILKALAEAEIRAGEPEGQARLRTLLEQHPELKTPHLLALLESGPPPPVESGLRINLFPIWRH